MTLLEDTIYYHIDGDVRRFKAGDDAPGEGWATTPYPSTLQRLAEEVIELRGRLASFDHDGDGKPGGRKKKAG